MLSPSRMRLVIISKAPKHLFPLWYSRTIFSLTIYEKSINATAWYTKKKNDMITEICTYTFKCLLSTNMRAIVKAKTISNFSRKHASLTTLEQYTRGIKKIKTSAWRAQSEMLTLTISETPRQTDKSLLFGQSMNFEKTERMWSPTKVKRSKMPIKR